MAVLPSLAGFKASSRISKRNFAFRAASSGPWHLKQFSVRIGRIWLLKSIEAPLLFGESIALVMLLISSKQRIKRKGGIFTGMVSPLLKVNQFHFQLTRLTETE